MKKDELLKELEEMKAEITNLNEAVNAFAEKLNEPEGAAAPKFKVGDILKITAAKHGHGFKIGDVVRVCGSITKYDCECEDNFGETWYVNISECEKFFSNKS